MSVKPKKNTPLAAPIPLPSVTAVKTLKSNAFLEACREQGVEATKRQAAKYNARRGRWTNR